MRFGLDKQRLRTTILTQAAAE